MAPPSLSQASSTVYPSRSGTFPAATFFTRDAEFAYIRSVQAELGDPCGICVCPAESFWLRQEDTRYPAPQS